MGEYGKIWTVLLHTLVEMSMDDDLMPFTLVHLVLRAFQFEL
jgi:hypothetical protein